jgi:hypothetical protein
MPGNIKSEFGNGVVELQWIMSLRTLRHRREDDIKVDGVKVWFNSCDSHAMHVYTGQDDRHPLTDAR